MAGGYGGGSGGCNNGTQNYGKDGAIRIIWPGVANGFTRAFPATNTGDF
jgi:hypothetical protein